MFPPELTVYQHTQRKTIRIPSLTGVRSAEAIFLGDESPASAWLRPLDTNDEEGTSGDPYKIKATEITNIKTDSDSGLNYVFCIWSECKYESWK